MAKPKILPTSRINIKNKRAEHDFLVVDKFTAGIVLTGTEIKSIRAGKASLVDTFCYIHNGELWMKNSYIAEYDLARSIIMPLAVIENCCSIAKKFVRCKTTPSRLALPLYL